MRAVAAGHDVAGYDTVLIRVKRLEAGESYVGVPASELTAALRSGRFRPSASAMQAGCPVSAGLGALTGLWPGSSCRQLWFPLMAVRANGYLEEASWNTCCVVGADGPRFLSWRAQRPGAG
jgi:hypothetical protein